MCQIAPLTMGKRGRVISSILNPLVGKKLDQCLSVCPSILSLGARTAGRIGTGEAQFDAPEQRKDDGGNRRVIGTT